VRQRSSSTHAPRSRAFRHALPPARTVRPIVKGQASSCPELAYSFGFPPVRPLPKPRSGSLSRQFGSCRRGAALRARSVSLTSRKAPPPGLIPPTPFGAYQRILLCPRDGHASGRMACNLPPTSRFGPAARITATFRRGTEAPGRRPARYTRNRATPSQPPREKLFPLGSTRRCKGRRCNFGKAFLSTDFWARSAVTEARGSKRFEKVTTLVEMFRRGNCSMAGSWQQSSELSEGDLRTLGCRTVHLSRFGPHRHHRSAVVAIGHNRVITGVAGTLQESRRRVALCQGRSSYASVSFGVRRRSTDVVDSGVTSRGQDPERSLQMECMNG